MSDEIIWGSLIVLFILFVFIIPAFLYSLLKKLVNPVPVYLPVLLALLVPMLLALIRMLNLISETDVTTGTVTTFLLLFLMMDLAVVAPFALFEQKIGSISSWTIFALPMVTGFFFFFYMTAGEAFYGRPMPPFSAPLPLTGWILDGAASVLGLQDIVYAFGSPVYEVLREAGLFLEVFIIAVVYYWVLSLVPKQKPFAE